MFMSPAGLGTQNDCAGEDQQQFTRPTRQSLRSPNLCTEELSCCYCTRKFTSIACGYCPVTSPLFVCLGHILLLGPVSTKCGLYVVWRNDYSSTISNFTCLALMVHQLPSNSSPSDRPWRHTGVWDVDAPTFSRKSAHRWRWSCQPCAPAAL
jgi:hypothetical protein